MTSNKVHRKTSRTRAKSQNVKHGSKPTQRKKNPSSPASQQKTQESPISVTEEQKLRRQYGIIIEDIEKLKKDLHQGYILAKNAVESHQIWTGLFGPK